MDNRLLDGCRAGDPESWNTLLGRLYAKGLACARGILRDKELAQDVVQNSLLKVYKHLGDIRDPSTFPAWFQRVVTNEAYLALRVYRKEIDTQWTEAPFFADPSEQATLKAELVRALRLIPLDFQEAVVLCDLLDWSMEEAAGRCGVPLGTLKSRLFRGQELLRRYLAEFRADAKEKCQVQRPIEDVLYDYLEGRLSAVEEAAVQESLKHDHSLQQRLAEQKKFLTLLHSLTGKLSLSAAEIAGKMQEVYAAIDNYEYTAEDTLIAGNRPQTLVQKVWFKKPDLRRIEAEHPVMGKVILIVKGQYVTSYYPDQQKALRSKLTQEFLGQMGEDFAGTLKDITTNNTTALVGSEFVEGRNCYHLKLLKSAPGDQGRLLTHLWLDKLTWMPILTEQYNSEGNLINRKVVRNLVLNAGIPDSMFCLEPGIEVEDVDTPEIKPPRKITLAEARSALPFIPLVLPTSTFVLNSCNLFEIHDSPVLMLEYHLPGEPLPQATVTQSLVYHTNLPPGVNTEEVALGDGPGQYLALEVLNIKGLLSFQRGEVYVNLGGNYGKDELIGLAKSLLTLQ